VCQGLHNTEVDEICVVARERDTVKPEHLQTADVAMTEEVAAHEVLVCDSGGAQIYKA
jgi:hypothetical protein